VQRIMDTNFLGALNMLTVQLAEFSRCGFHSDRSEWKSWVSDCRARRRRGHPLGLVADGWTYWRVLQLDRAECLVALVER
jgi:hypothetical protein